MSRPRMIVIFISVATVVFGALALAAIYRHSDNSRDIAIHPDVLFDRNVAYTAVSLRGVRLGDPESAIASGRRKPRRDPAMVECKDGASYGLAADSHVKTLCLTDSEVLSRLQLATPEQIREHLGAADDVNEMVGGADRSYNFTDRHIELIIIDGRLSQIVVLETPALVTLAGDFAKSAGPFVEQLRGLQARVRSGISLNQLNDKLQAVVDARAQVEGSDSFQTAAKFTGCADDALHHYQQAAEHWASSLELGDAFRSVRINDLQEADKATNNALEMYDAIKRQAGTK